MLNLIRIWLSGAIAFLLAGCLGLAAAHASAIKQCFPREPQLVSPNLGNNLANALMPTHYYMHQVMMIRLVPPSQTVFEQHLRGSKPIHPTLRSH